MCAQRPSTDARKVSTPLRLNWSSSAMKDTYIHREPLAAGVYRLVRAARSSIKSMRTFRARTGRQRDRRCIYTVHTTCCNHREYGTRTIRTCCFLSAAAGMLKRRRSGQRGARRVNEIAEYGSSLPLEQRMTRGSRIGKIPIRGAPRGSRSALESVTRESVRAIPGS